MIVFHADQVDQVLKFVRRRYTLDENRLVQVRVVQEWNLLRLVEVEDRFRFKIISLDDLIVLNGCIKGEKYLAFAQNFIV